MKLKASKEAKEQRYSARNALSTSICLHPPEAPTDPELGKFRDKAVLDFVYCWGYTLPQIACLTAGMTGRKEHTSDRINRLEKQGLLEREDFSSKHYRQLVMLTPSGYRYIDEVREEWRVELEASGTIGMNPLPRMPMAKRSRIPFTTLDHDLTVQCIAMEFSGLLTFAPERNLHGSPFRRPDALVERPSRDNSNGKEIVAIEYDKSTLSKPRTERRLMECERVLVPNLDQDGAESHDTPGAGGINRWVIVCNSWAQVKKYRNLLKAGEVAKGNRAGSHSLHKSRYLILHISQLNAPRLGQVLSKLVDGMPRP